MKDHGGSLADRAIDVWHLDLIDAHADRSLLSDDELQRADRLKIDGRRTQFVAGRALLRRILATYLETDPTDVAFEYGEHGKPTLAGDALAFNLSHSADRGLLAIAAPGLELGVDIEYCKPSRSFLGIAGRFFAEPESAALLALPEDRRPEAFYRAWTCKEAYLKAWGTGLSFASNRFTIDYVDRDLPELLGSEMPGEDERPWRFVPVPVEGPFDAAVCYRGEDRWLRHFVRINP